MATAINIIIEGCKSRLNKGVYHLRYIHVLTHSVCIIVVVSLVAQFICIIIISQFYPNTYIFSSTAQCLPLASIPNGVITYDPDMIPDYDVDTVATHTCNLGFRLSLGNVTRVCLASGRWSGITPVCLGT